MDMPPFSSPSEHDLRGALRNAGLAEDGMGQLSLEGEPLQYRSTVGWIYCGCTIHRAAQKLHIATDPVHEKPDRRDDGSQLRYGLQHHGELDAMALRQAGAVETIREHFNTRAIGHISDESLCTRLMHDVVPQANPPAPQFGRLQAGLDAAGIHLSLTDGGLVVRFGAPAAPNLDLAEPTPHPWLVDHIMNCVGRRDDMPTWLALEEANRRLQRALATNAPAMLRDRARAQLAQRLAGYLDDVVTAQDLQFGAIVLFSARGVIAPG